MPSNGMSAASPVPPTDKRIAGARLALVMLLAINLFNYLDRQVLAAVEMPIREDLLAGDYYAGTKSGALSLAFLISYMLLAPVFGYLGDRVSRWMLMGIGVIVWTLASGASGLAGAFAVLFLTRCVVGIGEAAYGPIAPTVISDLYPVKDRGWVLSWFYVAIPVGSALGYALGSEVVKAFPDDIHAWKKAFYLVVPPGLILGVFCFFMRDPKRGQADPGVNAEAVEGASAQAKRPLRERLADYKSFLCTRSYVYNTLGMTAMTFALGGMAWWMNALLKTRDAPMVGRMEPGTFFGVLLALAGLLATLAGGYAGDLVRRWVSGSYFLVSGLAMLLAFPAILLFLYTPFPAAWIFLFLAVFFLFFNTGPTNTILANVTHPGVRSAAFALNILFIHLFGDAISPFVIGFAFDILRNQAIEQGVAENVAELHAYNIAFIGVSVLVVVGAILWLWGTRYLQRDTELAPNRLALPPA